eukprot:m.209299 g.209299  ORF g.209299 m.209299 type:complete len:273 (-) comp13771_c0_seq26:129-947(-)
MENTAVAEAVRAPKTKEIQIAYRLLMGLLCFRYARDFSWGYRNEIHLLHKDISRRHTIAKKGLSPPTGTPPHVNNSSSSASVNMTASSPRSGHASVDMARPTSQQSDMALGEKLSPANLSNSQSRPTISTVQLRQSEVERLLRVLDADKKRNTAQTIWKAAPYEVQASSPLLLQCVDELGSIDSACFNWDGSISTIEKICNHVLNVDGTKTRMQGEVPRTSHQNSNSSNIYSNSPSKLPNSNKNYTSPTKKSNSQRRNPRQPGTTPKKRKNM